MVVERYRQWEIERGWRDLDKQRQSGQKEIKKLHLERDERDEEKQKHKEKNETNEERQKQIERQREIVRYGEIQKDNGRQRARDKR